MSFRILKIFLILSFSEKVSSKFFALQPRLFEDSLEGSGMKLAIDEHNELNPEGFQYDDYVLTNDKHFQHFELETPETPETPEIPISDNSIFSMIFNGGQKDDDYEYEEPDCVARRLSFFIPNNAVNTNIFGSQASILNVCSECAHGIQPTFARIQRNFSAIEPFNFDDPVIGSFYCPNGEICIEEEDGEEEEEET